MSYTHMHSHTQFYLSLTELDVSRQQHRGIWDLKHETSVKTTQAPLNAKTCLMRHWHSLYFSVISGENVYSVETHTCYTLNDIFLLTMILTNYGGFYYQDHLKNIKSAFKYFIHGSLCIFGETGLELRHSGHKASTVGTYYL